MEIIIYSKRRAAYGRLFDEIRRRAVNGLSVSFCDNIDDLAGTEPAFVIADPQMLEGSSVIFDIFSGTRGENRYQSNTRIIISAPGHPASAVRVIEKTGLLSGDNAVRTDNRENDRNTYNAAISYDTVRTECAVSGYSVDNAEDKVSVYNAENAEDKVSVHNVENTEDKASAYNAEYTEDKASVYHPENTFDERNIRTEDTENIENIKNTENMEIILNNPNTGGGENVHNRPDTKLLQMDDRVEDPKSDVEAFENVERTCKTENAGIRYGEPLRVGIAGMGHHAGASFVTMVLAEELASEYVNDGSVVIFSTGSAYYYDSLGFESKFSENSFLDAESYAAGRPAADSANINLHEGISWIVSSPVSVRKPITQTDRMRTLYRIKSSVILWDIGYELFNSDPETAVRDIDALIFVIDPLPSLMLEYYDIFKKVKGLDIPVIYVLNKMNSGIDRNEAESFLKIKKPEIISMVPAENIYESEYACENPYRNKDVRRLISDSVTSISDRLRKR